MQDGGEEDVEYEVGIIRSRYQRRRPDPAAPAQVGLARFSRTAQKPTRGNQADEEESDEEFDTKLTEDNQVVEYANLQTGPRRMSRLDAQKFMKKKYGLS
jgi:hypothetical protein